MMTDYESTCNRLDELALQNLRLSNDLIRLKLDLDTRLRDGWLSMAKTRFLTGYHRFGKVNLADYELIDAPEIDNDPQIVVDLQSVSISGKPKDDYDWKSINKNRKSGDQNEKSNDGAKVIKFTARIDGGNENDQKKGKEEMEKKLLKKFGGLTPGSFKQGQRCFETVLEVICEIASAESELTAVIEEYKTLSDLKSKIQREG